MRKRGRGSKFVKKAADTVEAVAGEVELAANEVRQGAHAVGKFASGNSSHKATRSKSPKGTIVRAESNSLPEIPSRIYCNPLDPRKLLFGKSIAVHPAGETLTTQAVKYFDNYVYTAIETAIIQQVKYDTSSFFTLANVRSYFNKMAYYYFTYKSIAVQKAFLTDGNTVSQRVNVRIQNVYKSILEQSLKDTQFVLCNYCMPPNLIKMLDWLSDIYALERTPNANIAQFITSEINLAPTNVALATILNGLSTGMSTTDRQISGTIGKLFPSWRMSPPKYVDMDANAKLDFNWLNVWYNMGVEDTATAAINPQDSLTYTLFNDNPNTMCTALGTIYDSTQAQWEPNIITPALVASSDYTTYVDDTTGLYTAMSPVNPRLIGALRNMEFQLVPGTFLGVDSHPGGKSVELAVQDLMVDTSDVMYTMFHVDDIVSASNSALRSRN